MDEKQSNQVPVERPQQQGMQVPLDKLLARLGEKDLEVVMLQDRLAKTVQAYDDRIQKLQKENSELTEKYLSLEKELDLSIRKKIEPA